MGRNIPLQFTEQVMNAFPNPADYLTEIASTFTANVKILAQQNLKTARQDYINAVNQYPIKVDGDKLSVTIELVGDFPNMLEQGHDSYDMKPGFLKDGDSRIIFIRKGTPSATRIQRMSSEQHKIMRNLKTSSDKETFPPFLLKKGSNVTAYGVHKIAKGKEVRKKSFTGYGHRNDINQRMQKIVRGRTPTYGTFRTVSVSSDADSWHHPGFQALDFFEQALRQMGLD